MTAIGIIGSGNIGSQLARAFAHAGHDITIANSRGPETLERLVGEINAATASQGGGGTVTAGSVAQAAQAGDTVVVTIPLKAVPSIPAPLLAGRTVIDTNNYYPERDGQMAELDDESLTTAEFVARHFSGATIVKVFNHIPSGDITGQAQPSGSDHRRALTVHSDDEAAKGAVSAIIDAIGFDPLDGGTLADSWRIQRDTPAYGPRFTKEELTAKLAEAKRYRDM